MFCRYSELKIFMNNLSSYCGLVDPRINVSDKRMAKKVTGQLPVAEVEDLRSSPTQKVLSQSDPLDRQGSI